MTFHRIAGLVFAVVAVAHAYRAALSLPLQVGSAAVPVWASWLAAIVGGLLSVWGFRSRAR
jgi:hypothetical protein